MRWYVFITLVQKEWLRHWTNRGSLLTVVAVVGATAYLACGRGLAPARVECCFVDYWQDGPWIAHLRRHVPSDLAPHVHFRPIAKVAGAGEIICYPARAGAIQVRGSDTGLCKVWIWHPGTDADVLAPFEAWFWQETACFFRQQIHAADHVHWEQTVLPPLEIERSSLDGSGDRRALAATALVLFALFFACVYLLPSWTCEERERGLLLAVALSPATTLEILAARAFFYAALGAGLAVLAASLSVPAVLGRPFFWLTLAVAAAGAAGVGLCIASLARTQRSASLAALVYTLLVALVVSVLPASGLPELASLALEAHVARMLQAALGGAVEAKTWAHAGVAAALAMIWLGLAAMLFRRRGWQ